MSTEEDYLNNEEEISLKKLTHDFRYNLQKFVYGNKVISSAVSYSVGLITKDVITAILEKLVIPLFFGIFSSVNSIKYVEKITNPLSSFFYNIHSQLLNNIGHITWLLIVWILTIILSYLMLEYFLNRFIIGLKTRIPDNKKDDFVRSRLASGDVYIKE